MHNYHTLVPSHEKRIVVGSLRNFILTLILTAEVNIWIVQYHDKNFTEKKLKSWDFNNIPAIAEIKTNYLLCHLVIFWLILAIFLRSQLFNFAAIVHAGAPLGVEWLCLVL